MDKTETFEQPVDIGGMIWTVRLTGDVLQVIDEVGRERHRSKGHLLTGTFLAMRLAEIPFESTPTIDRALQMRAAELAVTNSSRR